MGDARWPADLILSVWTQAETGRPPTDGSEYRVGQSDGGFDVLDFKWADEGAALPVDAPVDLSIPLNRRSEGGIEAFYNFAITPWLRLSADLQVIDPWNPGKSRAAYGALRLQTKF
jgi:hypothetical protein